MGKYVVLSISSIHKNLCGFHKQIMIDAADADCGFYLLNDEQLGIHNNTSMTVAMTVAMTMSK